MSKFLRFWIGPIALGLSIGITNAIFDGGWLVVFVAVVGFMIGYADGKFD